ncbi:MAG: D-hexose-6-phosphate mutarotase [Verrucomicrobiota bacterium]
MHASDYSWQLPPHSMLSQSEEGLPLVVLNGDFGAAKFAVQGAHLIEFTPKGQSPLLFVSSKSHYALGKAIRGGIPVIFPWFGPREGHPEAPMHGLVRTRPWSVDAVSVPEVGPAQVRFSLNSSAETLVIWPYPFRLELEFTLGPALEIRWTVENTGAEAFSFEQALHPYFPVQDVNRARVLGLENAAYIDKTDHMERKIDSAPAVTFQSETDRLYLDTSARCVLQDPAANREITFEKEGSLSSVVWNPWIAKAAALADMDGEDWRRFVCVEQVNAARNAIELPAGDSHVLAVRYFSQTLSDFNP